MNLYLIVIILVLALLNKDFDKKLMFGALAVFQCAHYFIAGNLSGDAWLWYDVTGALILFALSQCFGYDKKHAIYHLILSVGIISNLTDYVFWYNDIPQDPSRMIFMGLYSYTIILLMSGAAYDAGNRAALYVFDGLCSLIDKDSRRHLVKAERVKS